MAVGVTLRLHNGAAPLASLTGLVCLWWDSEQVGDLRYPNGRTSVATTDVNGDLILDLSDVSGHAVGGTGYLLVRQEATPAADSLVFQGKVTTSTVVGGTKLSFAYGWAPPVWWAPINDTHTPGESRFEGLHYVFEGGENPVAFSFDVIGGYNVDWGDGSSVESFASGATAEKLLNYADAPLLPQAPNGARQVVIKVTPQLANPFTGINLLRRHSGVSPLVYHTKWIDVYINGPSITSFAVGGTSPVKQGFVRFQAPELAVTNLTSAMRTCESLEYVPVFDTSSATSLSSMFTQCRSLLAVGPLNTSLTTNFASMFRTCPSLQSVPLFDTSGATTVHLMFDTCTSLASIPLFNISGCSTLTSFISNCVALKSIPLFDFSSASSMAQVLQNSAQITSIPLLNVASATSFTNIFQNCLNLQRGAMSGTSESITYPAALLSGAALNEIYTNLATVVGKTITVTGNYGTATHDPTIATAKGWTVVS